MAELVFQNNPPSPENVLIKSSSLNIGQRQYMYGEEEDKFIWLDDLGLDSYLRINVTAFDTNPLRYRLEVNIGGWIWALWRTFADIKVFYVNLCRLDKTSFVRLQNHFPIVGSRREGSTRHAATYFNRIKAFLNTIALKIDFIGCKSLRELIRFDKGMQPYIYYLIKAQALYRGYRGRHIHAPMIAYIKEKALMINFDMDRRRFGHLWQLAQISSRILLTKEPVILHKEILKLYNLAIPPQMYAPPIRNLVLDGDVGTLTFIKGEWVFHQAMATPAYTRASLASDVALYATVSGMDIAVANALLAEVVCESVFFDVYKGLSPRNFSLEENLADIKAIRLGSFF